MISPLAESLNKINAVSQVQADGKQELYYLHIGSPSTLACTEVPGSEVIHVVHFLNVCVDSGGSGGDDDPENGNYAHYTHYKHYYK